GLFIALFFLWGGGYNTGPIFLAALLKAFHWSHTRVGSIIGGLSLAVGISAPIAGWLLDRIEARWVMGTGAAMAVLGLLGASSSRLRAAISVGNSARYRLGCLHLARRLAGNSELVSGPARNGARPGDLWNGIGRHGHDVHGRQHHRC